MLDDGSKELKQDSKAKLTDWANEPSVEDLKQDYTEAQSAHALQVSKIDTWLDNLLIRGSAVITKKPGKSSHTPKLIRKQAEWRYAALSEPFLSQEDLFKVAPRTWKDKQAAIQNGMLINYQFNNQIDRIHFIDEYVRTVVDEGTVIVRVGWESESYEEEVEEPVMGVQPVTDLSQVQALLESGQDPLEPVQVGTKLVNKTFFKKNQPTLEICNYNNVYIDPTCNGELKKANFIIFEFETSLSDLEKAGKYSNLDQIDIEHAESFTDPDYGETKTESFRFQDKPRKKFVAREYWGFWDIHETGIVEPFLATWVGDIIIRMEESPFPDKELPFVVVPYLPVRKSVYGEPDGELLEENQKILGAVTRGVIDILGRSAAGQKAIRIDALDVTNRRKFEMGQDYEFNAHVDPRQAFYDHIYPEIPASAQFMMELQQLDAESLTGVKAFHGGISGEGLGKTATGVRGALDAAAKRELGILRRLAEGLRQIAVKILSMNAEFLSDEEIIRITDEDFVTINRENLVGQFDLTLDISSAETDNIKAQELAFMLQTMGNSMDPGMSQIILADIARLRKMPELAKRIETYQPQPNPIQQQMQMLELQLKQAEVAKVTAEAQAKQAGALLDQARARESGANADIKDLDFLNQQTGRTHLQDMQKQGAQAQANMLLKEREADLKGRNDAISNFFKLEQQRLKQV